MRVLRRLTGAFALTSTLVTAQNLSFITGTPTQCDNLNITWQGGIPPIVVTITQPHGTVRNTTLPFSDSNANGSLTYGVPIPFTKGETILVTLSDATGFASGGTSQLLTVGSPVGGNNCNTTNPPVDFMFEMTTPLTQCQSYTVSSYSGAIQPVTIFGLIPGGQSFVMTPPISANDSFAGVTNIKAGTSLVLSMIDSRGRTGGVSDVLTVATSTATSCLADAPSSTPPVPFVASPATAPPVASNTTTATPSNTPVTQSSAHKTSGLPMGAIAGIASGSLILIMVIMIIIFFVCKRFGLDTDFFSTNTRSVTLIHQTQSSATIVSSAEGGARSHRYNASIPSVHQRTASNSVSSSSRLFPAGHYGRPRAPSAPSAPSPPPLPPPIPMSVRTAITHPYGSPSTNTDTLPFTSPTSTPPTNLNPSIQESPPKEDAPKERYHHPFHQDDDTNNNVGSTNYVLSPEDGYIVTDADSHIDPYMTQTMAAAAAAASSNNDTSGNASAGGDTPGPTFMPSHPYAIANPAYASSLPFPPRERKAIRTAR